MNIIVPTTSQVAATLERAARVAAPFIALVVSITLLLMQLAYDLGYQLGQAVHARNDQLAAFARQAVQQPAPTPVAVVLTPAAPLPIPAAPAAPLEHPFMALATELEQLTRSQLQAMTGCRRKISKAQLIAMALA